MILVSGKGPRGRAWRESRRKVGVSAPIKPACRLTHSLVQRRSEACRPSSHHSASDPEPSGSIAVSPQPAPIECDAENARNYLQSPYYFMCCNLWNANEERAAQTTSQSVLAGTLVSSLHRLKDIDNTGELAWVFPHKSSVTNPRPQMAGSSCLEISRSRSRASSVCDSASSK